jgi:hypothetical protein
LINRADWAVLAGLVERLTAETLAVEAELLERHDLHRRIALPRPLRPLFARRTPSPSAARVMRFDFHFTAAGWCVSEVNSDVPGGYTEATNVTRLVAAHVPGATPAGEVTDALLGALSRRVGDGAIALVSAPGHMEDHQVVAHLAACLRARGRDAHVLSPHHLRWSDGRARIETAWHAGEVAAIVRFYQAEWLATLPPAVGWRWLFVDGRTPVANAGVAVLTESKRLPLVWDDLRTPVPTWRRLLPETRALADAPWRSDDGWLIKSAYSNTGDTVTIREALPRREWARRAWAAQLRPGSWVAQRRFEEVAVHPPNEPPGGPLRCCVGVYTVDGKAAGAYARLAREAVVDAFARDVALLISDAP